MPSKEVALTFDDGPNPPYTLQILDILRAYKIPGTFFVCGENLSRHPEVAKEISSKGHLLGSHGFHHLWWPSVAGLTYEGVIRTQELIREITGQEDKLYRAPFGFSPPWFRRKLKEEGFIDLTFKWGRDAKGFDWQKRMTPEKITDCVLREVKPGSIIVLHDGYRTVPNADTSRTVAAVELIIERLKKDGYGFVRAIDLVNHS